jgi:phage shock protein C
MKIYNKKLYKSRDNKIIAGVMGGLGEYFEVDPVLFRVVYLGICAFTAFIPGMFAYLLMAIVMPKRPEVLHEESNS